VVTAELIAAGHHVTVYDNLCHGHRAAVSPEARLVEADIADRAALERVLREGGIEAVLHFAALIEAGESMRSPETYFRVNTAGSLTLLEAMLAAGVRRLVFSSTAAVYGEPDSTPIREDAPLEPTNVYGVSKMLVERMLAWFHRIHGLRYASLRYFNAAGAAGALGEAHQPESHLIPLALQVAMGHRPAISIYGTDYPTRDGTCVRDYVHVSDLAHAHLLALDALEQRDSAIYNLGNGHGFTVREVIEAARKVTGHPIPAVEAPRRAGDPAVLVADSDRIFKELGWRPQCPDLETIVASAWQWQREHPEGYRARQAPADRH
jgi:UDP-glucose 4-epimerase